MSVRAENRRGSSEIDPVSRYHDARKLFYSTINSLRESPSIRRLITEAVFSRFEGTTLSFEEEQVLLHIPATEVVYDLVFTPEAFNTGELSLFKKSRTSSDRNKKGVKLQFEKVGDSLSPRLTGEIEHHSGNETKTTIEKNTPEADRKVRKFITDFQKDLEKTDLQGN